MCVAVGAEGRVVDGAHSWLLADPDAFGEVITNDLNVARLARDLEASPPPRRGPFAKRRRARKLASLTGDDSRDSPRGSRRRCSLRSLHGRSRAGGHAARVVLGGSSGAARRQPAAVVPTTMPGRTRRRRSPAPAGPSTTLPTSASVASPSSPPGPPAGCPSVDDGGAPAGLVAFDAATGAFAWEALTSATASVATAAGVVVVADPSSVRALDITDGGATLVPGRRRPGRGGRIDRGRGSAR